MEEEKKGDGWQTNAEGDTRGTGAVQSFEFPFCLGIRAWPLTCLRSFESSSACDVRSLNCSSLKARRSCSTRAAAAASAARTWRSRLRFVRRASVCAPRGGGACGRKCRNEGGGGSTR